MRVYGKVGVAGRMQMFVIEPVDSESRLAVLTEAVTVSLWIMGISERYNQAQLRRRARVPVRLTGPDTQQDESFQNLIHHATGPITAAGNKAQKTLSYGKQSFDSD